MQKAWPAIAVGSFTAAYLIYWSTFTANDEYTDSSAPRPKLSPPTPVPQPPSAIIEQQAAQEEAARKRARIKELKAAAQQEAARRAAEQQAARQEAARQEAARQEAARQEAARKAAEQAAYAAKEMARIKELKKAQADKRKAEAEATKIISRKEEFANAYALESTYPDWWPGTKAPNVINHHPLIVEMLNKANSLGVLGLYQDRSTGSSGPGPRLLRPPMRSEDNLKAAKQTLAQFKEMKAVVGTDIYPADRQLVNLIINYLGGLIRKAEIIEEARIQNAKSRAEYEAAVAAAAPNVQTNYLITLQNPIEVSILIGNLNKAAKLHIRESSKKYVLSTRPWGNNIIPKSSKNDGYIDGLDLLKLPINPKKVDKVNRKVLEAGMDEYGGGFKLTFTDNKGKKLIEIDLGSPTSVTDVPVDRANSEIDDIGRNIRYSANVVSYQ